MRQHVYQTYVIIPYRIQLGAYWRLFTEPCANSPTTVQVELESATEEESVSVDNETLQFFGKPPRPKTSSLTINTNLSAIWGNIIKNGLSSAEKEVILGKYETEEATLMLGAPLLNREIAQAVQENVRKRDKNLHSTQRQMSATLSAIGAGLTDLSGSGSCS